MLAVFGCSLIPPPAELEGDDVVALGVAIEPCGQKPPDELPGLVTALAEFCLKTILGLLLAIAGKMTGNGNVAAGVATGVALTTLPFWVHTCIEAEPDLEM